MESRSFAAPYGTRDTRSTVSLALNWPGSGSGGAMVSFEIKGGYESGKKFLDNIRMLSLSANLGDTRTIATHPASTTHSKLSTEERKAVGITDGLIRISVGLEHIDDIVEDIEQSLAQI